MINKLQLAPTTTKFKIDTTDMKIEMSSDYSELMLFLDIRYRGKNNYSAVKIIFDTTAKYEYTRVNFWEFYHTDYEIENLDGDDFANVCGIYIIKNSKWQDFIKECDPKNRHNLKHFLVTGNDSFIEVLAKDYKIEKYR